MQLSKTGAKSPTAPQERARRLTCSDVRQTERRTRNLAQPHQRGKRQIQPPAQRERHVGPLAPPVKGLNAGLFAKTMPRLEPGHEAWNPLRQRGPRRESG